MLGIASRPGLLHAARAALGPRDFQSLSPAVKDEDSEETDNKEGQGEASFMSLIPRFCAPLACLKQGLKESLCLSISKGSRDVR